MKYPTSTVPAEWAQAFERWITDEDSVFDTKAMEEWFRAAFEAAGQATTSTEVQIDTTANPVGLVVETQPAAAGVWVATGNAGIPIAADKTYWFVVFPSELEALRHALKNRGDAEFVEFGEERSLP